MTSYGPFAAVSLLEYGGLKPILPFLGGRSDAARRVVIHLYAIPVDPLVGANDGRCAIPRNDLPANADCRGGVFATRRFPRPPRLLPVAMRIPCTPQASHLCGPTVFTTMRHAALVREGTRYARHLPYQDPYEGRRRSHNRGPPRRYKRPSHSRRRPEYTSATRTRRGLALRAEVTTHFPRGMSASRPPGMACGAAPSAAPCADS